MFVRVVSARARNTDHTGGVHARSIWFSGGSTMAGSETLKVGRGELQANAVQVRGYAADIDQTLARTQQRVQALLESWLGLGAGAFSDLFQEWNQGARQVHESLVAIATRLERSGTAYDEHDQAVAGAIRSQ